GGRSDGRCALGSMERNDAVETRQSKRCCVSRAEHRHRGVHTALRLSLTSYELSGWTSRIHWPNHRSPKMYQAHPSPLAPMIATTDDHDRQNRIFKDGHAEPTREDQTTTRGL